MRLFQLDWAPLHNSAPASGGASDYMWEKECGPSFQPFQLFCVEHISESHICQIRNTHVQPVSSQSPHCGLSFCCRSSDLRGP